MAASTRAQAPATDTLYGHTLPSASTSSAFSHDTGAAGVDRDGDFEPARPYTAANHFRRSRSISATVPWKRRPKSLVMNPDEDPEARLSNDLREHAIDEHEHEHEHGGGLRSGSSLKGKIRRASMTLVKGIVYRRDRRCSEPGEFATPENHHAASKPTAAHQAWNKLRQATSLRHPRLALHGRSGLETIYSPLETDFPTVPVPGHGLEPPVIPQHTGAAAKASAALQNEYLAFTRQQEEVQVEQSSNDRESGIGISITPASDLDPSTELLASNSVISRVDFITRLPSELALQILAYLDAGHLSAVCRVSRAWRDMTGDQYVWRESFLREKTVTSATGAPVPTGKGLGVPHIRPGNDWQAIYRAKHELDKHWKEGNKARPVYLNGHLDSIYCIQFDESKIITGSRDKTIRIWDMHTFECRLVIGPPEVVNETAILFDDVGKPAHFASVSGEDRAHESVPATVSFPMHHKASILCLQYDENILITGSSDSSCIVYSIKSGYRPVRRLQGHTAAVLDLAFDEKHIVTCSKDITICVWDRNTGALLRQLRGHTGPVNAVQMRGNTVVSCSGDFRVKMWNIDSGKVIREFVGHTKGLACSQFSEDGRYIASAGSDKVIRIWDANTGECIREMQAHESLVRSLHIDSISGRLISGSYDTDIKVFDMETGAQLLDFPRWHSSWVLSAKSDYRRIVSTGQAPKILIMDFGAQVENVGSLESVPMEDVARGAGFI